MNMNSQSVVALLVQVVVTEAICILFLFLFFNFLKTFLLLKASVLISVNIWLNIV